MILVILFPTQVLLSLHSPGTILVTAPVKEYNGSVGYINMLATRDDDLFAPIASFVGTRESSLNARKGVFVSVIV